MKLLKNVISGMILASLIIVYFCVGESDEMNLIKERVAAYAEYEVSPDLSMLNENQKKVLDKMVEAAKAVDLIFWKQEGKEALLDREMLKEKTSERDKLYREYLEINYGPFDVRFDNTRFYGQGGAKPAGAGFYPENMTKSEFTAYVAAHPEKKEVLENLYTLVRRDGKELYGVWYHDEYKDDLEKAAKALKEASEFAENASLKKYLEERSKALLNDDYLASDMAWMDLKDNALDIIVGPIETYEDQLMGLKASYESAVLIKDFKQTENLALFKKHLDDLEHNLPIDDQYKRKTVGSGNLLEVLNVAYFSGDINKAIKTIAASLPNDERVHAAKGAKKQLFKNIMDAKFDTILMPLAKRLIVDEQHKYISQESFITLILLHEISHTLGPLEVYGSGGKKLREALQEHATAIEEGKADVIGVYSTDYFKKAGVLTEEELKNAYVTFLAGIFRSIRFGAEDAHGRSNVIQLNYLTEKGGMEKVGTKYKVNFDKFHSALADLGRKILTIQLTGDYKAAGELIEKYGTIPEDVNALLKSMNDIPVDLKLKFSM